MRPFEGACARCRAAFPRPRGSMLLLLAVALLVACGGSSSNANRKNSPPGTAATRISPTSGSSAPPGTPVPSGTAAGTATRGALSGRDQDAFKVLVQKAPCAETANRLYDIDGQMVFWQREGRCPDNMYTYTLFGQTPSTVLCTRTDSPAGPRTECKDESARPTFTTIVQNLGKSDLGLGAAHRVTRFSGK